MRTWIASIIIVLLFAASLYVLNSTGVDSRRYHAAYNITEKDLPIYLVKRSSDVYQIWKNKGMKGRVVLNIGDFLHFVGFDTSDIYKAKNTYPVSTLNLTEEYEKRIDNRNFLWVSMRSNIARKIYHVVSLDVYREKAGLIKEGLREKKLRGIFISGKTVTTHDRGSQRVITSHIPQLREPALLVIDASYFANYNEETLLQALRTSGLKTDMMILCLEEGNPNVTEREREKLRVFAEKLEK
jgi:hypothetical protein